MKSQAIIILGRLPKKGEVKTRLAKQIGEDKTLEFYETWLKNILNEASKLKNQTDIYFYHSDKNNHQELEKWLDPHITPKPPVSQNIEKNLEVAFSELFSKGYKKIVSISTDVPDLDSRKIKLALKWLDKVDIVIGPDNDGGIYLYATTKHYPHLFQNEYKKGDKVIEVLKKKLNALQLNYHMLNSLIDIDTKLDLETWQKTQK